MILGDSLRLMGDMDDDSFDLVLADPPYDNHALINDSIEQARRISGGPSLYFMYAETIYDLAYRPDQVLFWCKPVSTKNTSRRYSRFVEVICVYDLERSPFLQDNHWSVRSGVFNDTLVGPQVHPFQKPDSLIEKLLRVHTLPGYHVLDPFAGSGVIERVGENLDLEVTAIEINPALVPSRVRVRR